jgi:hypothetical protein
MQYMLLIYSDPAAFPHTTPEAAEAHMPEWFTYTEALIAAGAMVSGAPLQGVDVATTVRIRNGDRLVTDGPFAETKEHLGGYYIIECADLDAALGWAARIPSVGWGSVEVRPVMAM